MANVLLAPEGSSAQLTCSLLGNDHLCSEGTLGTSKVEERIINFWLIGFKKYMQGHRKV